MENLYIDRRHPLSMGRLRHGEGRAYRAIDRWMDSNGPATTAEAVELATFKSGKFMKDSQLSRNVAQVAAYFRGSAKYQHHSFCHHTKKIMWEVVTE